MGEIVEAQFQYLKQSIIELEAQITHPLITCMIDKCKEIMRLQESLGVGFGFPGPKDFYNNFKDISCNCRHLLQAMKDYNWDIYDQNREKVGKLNLGQIYRNNYHNLRISNYNNYNNEK